MAETVAGLSIKVESKGVLTAERRLSQLTVAGREAESTTNKLTRSFGGLAAQVGVAAAATAGLYKSISLHREFASSMSNLSAITGATGEDLKFYKEQALAIGETTTLSATQAVTAFKLIASAKPELLESKEALAAVTQETVALSEAATIDMPTAAKALAGSLNQFGESADQAGRFINVLAAGAKYGSSEIAQTAEAMEKAGVVASSAGLSFEEMNAAIQVVAKGEIKGSEAGTALRGVLLKLTSQTNDKFNPAIVGSARAFANLEKAALSTAEQKKLFGEEGITAAKILIRENKQLDILAEKLTGTSIAYEQASTNVDNFDGDLKGAISAAESLGLAIGESLDPTLRDMAVSAKDVSISLRELVPSAETVGDVIDILQASVAGLAAVIAARYVTAVRASILAENAAAISAKGLSGALGVRNTTTITATASTLALNRATALLSTTSKALGGPVGIAIAVATSLAAWFAASNDTVESTKNLTNATKDLSKAGANVSAVGITKQILDVEETLSKLRANIEKADKGIAKSAAAGFQSQVNYLRSLTEVDAERIIILEEKLKNLRAQEQKIKDLLSGKPEDEISKTVKADEEFDTVNYDDETRRRRENIAARYEELQDSFRSESELLKIKLEEDQQALRDGYELRGGDEEVFRGQQLVLAAQYENDLAVIKQRGSAKIVTIEKKAQSLITNAKAAAANAAIGFINALGSKSEAAAKLAVIVNRGVSIAQAIQNTAVGSTKALTIDPSGVLSANVERLGAIQIGLIAATGALELGGTGGASGGGSAPSSGQAQSFSPQPVAATELQRPPDVNITIAGDDSSTMTKRQLREMVDDIVEEIGDGGYRLNVA